MTLAVPLVMRSPRAVLPGVLVVTVWLFPPLLALNEGTLVSEGPRLDHAVLLQYSRVELVLLYRMAPLMADEQVMLLPDTWTASEAEMVPTISSAATGA